MKNKNVKDKNKLLNIVIWIGLAVMLLSIIGVLIIGYIEYQKDLNLDLGPGASGMEYSEKFLFPIICVFIATPAIGMELSSTISIYKLLKYRLKTGRKICYGISIFLASVILVASTLLLILQEQAEDYLIEYIGISAWPLFFIAFILAAIPASAPLKYPTTAESGEDEI